MTATSNSLPLTRRQFLAASTLTVLTARRAMAQKPAYTWVAGPEDYQDPVTGARVRVLTPGNDHQNQVIYQTHPMWAGDMDYLVFQSDRAGAMMPHALQAKSGIIRPVMDEPVGALTLMRKSDELYMMQGRRLLMQHVVPVFQRMRTPAFIAHLPHDVARVEGGISGDAGEEIIYCGVAFEAENTWGILALDLKNRRWSTVCTTDFRVGHVQAHPAQTGLVMFCKETGGDADQRIWKVWHQTGRHEPFYYETFNEWVTHEVWWTNNRILFAIWPYDAEHEELPHGVVSMELDGRDLRYHNQFPAWHVHGTRDGRWLMADDFERNLWLIDPLKGERRLLTQGHKHETMTTHPHASFTPDGKGIVFNSSRNGNEQIMLVELREWQKLKPPKA